MQKKGREICWSNALQQARGLGVNVRVAGLALTAQPQLQRKAKYTSMGSDWFTWCEKFVEALLLLPFSR